ncbi:MAG: type I restriction enzyme HsdR N-terminal domain-containing protein [Bacteroidales bacterium]|nr:type I restriction enzyme HsdR N-terminal domain-containing protein [Bacteroidales bacterium]
MMVWDPLRKKEVALTPEEKVRQWFIGVLRDSLGVPEHMMMSEVGFKLGDKPYRADILVYGRDLKPLAVVECKRPEVRLSKEVLEQTIRYNLVLDVQYIMITNGNSTIAYHKGEGFLTALPKYEEIAR